MKNYNHLNVLGTRILGASLFFAVATLTLVGIFNLVNASAIDGDHMQDATGVNTQLTNQVVRKGWGFMPGNGKFAIEDTPINYGITFDELPFLIVKFANSKQVAEGDPVDLADCSITRNVIAAGANQTANGFKPILRTPTGLGFPAITNYCYTWIAIGRDDDTYNGEEDPVFGAWDKSTGISITESQISDLNHFSTADETDQVFSASEAAGIAAADITNWNATFGWGDHSTQGYLTAEVDGDITNELQDLFATVTGDTGTTTADVQTDTLNIVGSGTVSTSILGDTLTITGTGDGTGTDDQLLSFVTGNLSIEDGNMVDLTSLTTNDADIAGMGYIKSYTEADPVFSAWDKSTGISITESQVSDLAHTSDADIATMGYIKSYTETDPVFGAWDKSTDISITESQISDLTHFTTGDETDPIFSAWDMSTGISIIESQITDLDHFTNADETDQVFTAWDKSSDISITESQVSDLSHTDDVDIAAMGYIKSYTETDPEVGTNTANYLSKWNGSSLVTSSIYDDGNVGIGTTTPTEKLTLTAGNFLQSPGDPIHVGAITNNATTELDGARSIYVSGKYAYVASYYDDGVEILDISDPTNPTHVGAITDNATTELDGAYSIYVSGKYAYVTSLYDNGVEILDISDPTNPTHVGAITDNGTTELLGARSIYVSGKYAYVAAGYDDGVEILDISDPTNPTHVGAITDDGTTELNEAIDIYVLGKYAYVASHIDDGVEILDISDPTNPTHIGAITDNATTELDGAYSIYVSGKYAYVASLVDNGVEILDISDPTNPTHIGAITDNATTALNGANGIYVSGKYAYVTSHYDNGVEILDISDPTNPTHVGAITDNVTTELDGAYSIYVSGKYAYVASYFDDGVEILDISGIDAPAASIGLISTSTIEITENAQVGNNLYVGTGLNVGTGGIHSDGVISAGAFAGISLPYSFGVDNSYVGTAGNYITFGHEGVSEDFIGYKSNSFYFLDSPGGSDVAHPNVVIGGYAFIGGHLQVDTLAGASSTDLCINGNTISSCSSSIRYKKNVKDLKPGIGTLKKLRPVTFEWKERGEKDFGFIAEEVARVNPLLVTYRDGRIEGVKYDQMSALFVNAFKEQQGQIEELKEENKDLNENVEQLKIIVCKDHPEVDMCR